MLQERLSELRSARRGIQKTRPRARPTGAGRRQRGRPDFRRYDAERLSVDRRARQPLLRRVRSLGWRARRGRRPRRARLGWRLVVRGCPARFFGFGRLTLAPPLGTLPLGFGSLAACARQGFSLLIQLVR